MVQDTSTKRKDYIKEGYCPELGEAKIMIFDKNKQLSSHKFGELELVDKSLFFICANRRDN